MGAAASLYAALEALETRHVETFELSVGFSVGFALEAPEKVGALVLATPPTAWATRARLMRRVETGTSSALDTDTPSGPPRSKICAVVPRKPRTCREAWPGNCQSSC